MKIISVFFIALMISGCPQTNSERVEAFKLCKDAGMRPADGVGEIVCMAK